ncbi:transposase [Paenibacillus sambharensis]|uniref:Transposase n=1 Tax=Paenibacillus sambharensis TaxID=1803190 RepID=A0A2W1L4R9_9BACL|nr:helix-turn-helix domain-containing protein [Paenibacillus sambharensis]PZD93142.1 transposase [Paenibacillus sambharensis]PZD93235.1 transposase [Paenibacillus sambharensis]PZD93242.1 transposase [Paenibacillus sambharensis]PZD93749.1 transposase [Paenibacillus sambharensis]PZD93797.1 transposase [Paenibacillus sambharensis]
MGKRLSKDTQLKIVKEALAGIKVGALARMYDIHPETIRTWIRDYRDTIPAEEIPLTDEHVQEMQRLQEVEQRYEKAVKVLGEKELEIEILRELLKKKDPAYLKNLK